MNQYTRPALVLILLLATTTALAHPPRHLHGPYSHGPARLAPAQHPHPHVRLAHWYANEATRQAQSARRMGCGFSGSRWTTSWHAHYDWALRNPSSRIHREIDNRDQGLHQCRQRMLRQHRRHWRG
ncbi:MAG: hypothetical protein JJU31_12050 [Wenzhouxiangella sp.]|nr:hypothetical protein [Wenzhouxiangella sp.]MCH8476568.1 hypothetical protein [Wenzhouxiangella sp.]TVR96063.1 MAG: hypothetical protein EA418_06105 [Wenzhouxiangellaceae bacterium]